MIRIPLSVVGDPEAFALELEAHRADLEAHRLGKPGIPAPINTFNHELLDALVLRVPDTGPVADRGPDKFVIVPYQIFDDTPPPPVPPEVQQALDTLRETISG